MDFVQWFSTTFRRAGAANGIYPSRGRTGISSIGLKAVFPGRNSTGRRAVVCALGTYSKIGGLQNFNRRVFQNLARRALERGEQYPFVSILGDNDAVIPDVEGIKIAGTKNSLLFCLKTICAGVGPADIFILCHINLLPLAMAVRCLRPKLPILLFVHGFEAWNSPRGRRRRWYEIYLLRAVTRIASVSVYTADIMAREFDVPKEKFALLPNAVDPISDAPISTAREPATILTVTRLAVGDREKNVDQMIRAVAKLKGQRPGLRYEIIGDGVLRPELEALAKSLGVSDIVTFFGHVSVAELRAAYARAKVFVMPSSKEGFGIVYLEAWQRGLPVICSSEGAAKEVVTDGVDGFVVDPADVSMLADRLNLLLTQPDRAAAMGENGRRKVNEKYLNSTFRSNLDAILDELLDGAKRR